MPEAMATGLSAESCELREVPGIWRQGRYRDRSESKGKNKKQDPYTNWGMTEVKEKERKR